MNVFCEEYIRQFDNATATVLQKQTFAECVRTVYPLASGVGETQIILGCVVAGTLIGLVLNREWIDDIGDAMIFSMLGGILGIVASVWILAVTK